MVYNEPEFFPIWRRYYASQFGEQNLFVIDHGSDDGSLDDAGQSSIIRLPRSPKSNPQRSAAISNQVAMLLNFYDHVIQVDADEFLVVDPRKHESLGDYCSKKLPNEVITSIGFNVGQLTNSEPDLDEAQPVLSQRKWAQFVSPMCKPNIVSAPVTFGEGFHGCDRPPFYSDVYCLHLRYFDKQMGLQRLARTRAMDWANPKAGTHQRVEDEQWVKMIGLFNNVKKGPELFTDAADELLEEYKNTVLESSSEPNPRGIYSPRWEQTRSKQLFSVPATMASLF